MLCGLVDRYQHFRGIFCLFFWVGSSETRGDQIIVLFTKSDRKIPGINGRIILKYIIKK
jgi:hypothetical protein